MSRFDTAQAALIRRKKAAEGKTVTYTRKATSADLTGWLGQGLQVNQADTGARIEVSEREIFFAVADLETAGFDKPQIGDRLLVDGESVRWEVMTPNTGEPAWRYSDTQRTMVRLHTKRVK